MKMRICRGNVIVTVKLEKHAVYTTDEVNHPHVLLRQTINLEQAFRGVVLRIPSLDGGPPHYIRSPPGAILLQPRGLFVAPGLGRVATSTSRIEILSNSDDDEDERNRLSPSLKVLRGNLLLQFNVKYPLSWESTMEAAWSANTTSSPNSDRPPDTMSNTLQRILSFKGQQQCLIDRVTAERTQSQYDAFAPPFRTHSAHVTTVAAQQENLMPQDLHPFPATASSFDEDDAGSKQARL